MMNTVAATNPSAGAPDRVNTSPSGASTPGPGRGRVLIVEDDGPLRELLALLLDEAGYEARAVGDGRAALAAAADWRPDLIVLDLVLPGLSGFAVRTAQLADPSTATVPVVVLSGKCNADARAESMLADAIIAKPFDLDDLLGVVGRVIRRA